MSGITGKNYQALKDGCKWRGLEEEIYLPILTKMAATWVANNKKD